MTNLEFAHTLRETAKLKIILTDPKTVTSCFRTKAIPPSLWKTDDYVLQFRIEKHASLFGQRSG